MVEKENKNLPAPEVLTGMIEQISELMTAISDMMANFIEYVSTLFSEVAEATEDAEAGAPSEEDA